MKKNLRIVSAAAAALLAVAPVAATVVPAASTTVSAADTNTATVTVNTKDTWIINANGERATNDPMFQKGDQVQISTTPIAATASDANNFAKTFTWWKNGETHNIYKITSGQYAGYYVLGINVDLPAAPAKDNGTSDKINAGSASIFDNAANTSVNISAVAASQAAKSAINGNVVVTLDGQQFTAMLANDANGNNVTIHKASDANGAAVPATQLQSNVNYIATFSDVKVNLGNKYANTEQTFYLPAGQNGAKFNSANAKNNGHSLKVKVNGAGVADLGSISAHFYAYDSADLQEVHFYSIKTGNVVTSGSVNLHAVNGKLSVQSVFAALNTEFVASQLSGNNVDTLVPVNDIKSQLEKANIKVDDNGYFTAPSSFTINMNAKSNVNGATATLPVTVNVDNATASNTNTQETTKTVTIMHISAIYDKNGVATHDPALRAYDTYSVVSEPVTINGAKFYKLAGKDQYIKVGNVDGTSRTLKHNSYVYKSTGKRANKKTLKKGSSVTTYGKSFMIAGHQMYRIGRNQYVKKANF